MNPITDLLDALRTSLPAASKVITEGAGNDVNQATLTGPLAAITSAVSATPNSSNMFPSRESYVQYGLAIKAALPDHPDEAFELFSDWCARWSEGENDPDVVAADWRRMKPPYRRGASWLYEQAEQYGAFDRSSVWWEPVPAASVPSLFEDAEAREREAASQAAANRFTFLPFDEAADMALGEKSTPLIKGLLDQGAMSVMYGDSNTGKTFVAMDMGFHIAAGLPYADMKTTKEVVVYIAAEGGRGAKKRLMALREKYGAKAKNVMFFLLATSVNLRDPAADLKPLIEALQALVERVGARVGFLVVDTMSRALAGGDENSSVDVGLLVKNFDALRAATGAHLMVVHHSGKDRARGARGWSGLRAATDTEIEIAENTITVGKQRDLDKSWTSGFALEVRTLGLDGDGDPITSCTVSLVAAAAVRRGVPTATEQDVLDAMDLISRTDAAAAHGVTAKMLESHFAANASPMTVENLRYYVRQLESKQLIEKAARGRWVRIADHPPLSSKDKMSGEFFEEVEESGGELEAGVFD